jgi:hypothetical protein
MTLYIPPVPRLNPKTLQPKPIEELQWGAMFWDWEDQVPWVHSHLPIYRMRIKKEKQI